MKITRVTLKPLKKKSKLHKFSLLNCVFCGFENDMFTMTFEINEGIMQDLVIDFSDKKHNQILISNPYTNLNADCEGII